MNLYKLLIYIYFVFNECQFTVLANETCPKDLIDSVKKFINNETSIIKDSIHYVINETTIIKDQLNKNETLQVLKKVEELSDYVKNKTDCETNSKNDQENKNERLKLQKKIDELSDSIHSVINETTNIKDQLKKNETLQVLKKIEELSDYVKNKTNCEKNSTNDQENKNERLKLQKKIDELSDSISFIKTNIIKEINIIKDKLNKNETSKSLKKIEELLDKLFICILVIAIILIIILLAEVRFKIITKIIQKWSGTNRINENCHNLSENSNNPLLDSRKSDSLKYELQNIKGEMNRIENVLLTTNTYALSELNTKIEKFYSDLDVQFQSFVKDANETIAKIKHEFVSQYESE